MLIGFWALRVDLLSRVAALVPQVPTWIGQRYPLIEDLAGIWASKESWGTKYVIERRPDGTFSETADFSKAVVSHHPAIQHSEGRYFLMGRSYGRIYLKSTELALVTGSPSVVHLDVLNSGEIDFTADEGNPSREIRK